MAFNFAGKKFLVTGAGRGIGRVIALSLARSGGQVFALSKTQSKLDTLVRERPDIVPLVQDLNDWDGTRHTLEQLEPLDGLVNNAAIGEMGASAVEVSKEEINRYLQTNLLSHINCTQMFAKKLIAAGKPGSVVNVSSIASLASFPLILGYGVSKAGIDMVSKQFALELGPHNIRVNSVNPTVVWTDMAKAASEATDGANVQSILGRTPLGRLLTEDEIAGPVLYLLSDYSSMVTGTCHIVDGGLLSSLAVKL